MRIEKVVWLTEHLLKMSSLLLEAMKIAETGIAASKAAKAKINGKRNVAFKTANGTNYLIEGNMKRKSFDRLVDKNSEAIQEFESGSETSLNLT